MELDDYLAFMRRQEREQKYAIQEFIKESPIAKAAYDAGLNPHLAVSQGIDEADIAYLAELHKTKDVILFMAQERDPLTSDGAEQIKILAGQLVDIELAMQSAWGFDRDPNYHTHWLNIHGCQCPKMDNLDPMYYGRGQIISGDCPIHSPRLPVDTLGDDSLLG